MGRTHQMYKRPKAVNTSGTFPPVVSYSTYITPRRHSTCIFSPHTFPSKQKTPNLLSFFFNPFTSPFSNYNSNSLSSRVTRTVGMSFEDLESGRPLALNGSQPQDPSQAVAGGVFRINTAVASFQRLVNTLGTPKDTLDLRQKLHKARIHIGNLVKETSAKLKQASETDQHTEVSAGKKIADAKLAKDFQSVLREFQKAQRLAAERETTYAPFIPKEVHSSRNRASELEISSSKSPEHLSLVQSESARQEVLQLENEIAFNEANIEEREQGIREIQQQIGEVNEIFKDLAVLVHEQGAIIDDISSNIESSHAATAQATFQLAKASKSQKSISSMSCLLLVIFGIILLIVVIVVMA